jgi:hypothetical protein
MLIVANHWLPEECHQHFHSFLRRRKFSEVSVDPFRSASVYWHFGIQTNLFLKCTGAKSAKIRTSICQSFTKRQGWFLLALLFLGCKMAHGNQDHVLMGFKGIFFLNQECLVKSDCRTIVPMVKKSPHSLPFQNLDHIISRISVLQHLRINLYIC